MRRGFWLGSVVSLAVLMMLVLPFGAQASPTAASSHLRRGAVLTHWWQARGNATDSVGTDNGRLVGVGFGPGVKGGTDQAFAFYNGARQVVFNRFGGNVAGGDYTFMFDIWTTAKVESAIWEKRPACDSDGRSFWGFRMTPEGIVGFESQDIHGKNVVDLVSKTRVNNGEWHQVAVTRTGRTVRLYVDGSLEATGTSPKKAEIQIKAPMRAGVSTCDGIDGTNPFTGELDELMIFASALRQPQIQALSSR
jgi:hypothetical protein